MIKLLCKVQNKLDAAAVLLWDFFAVLGTVTTLAFVTGYIWGKL